MGYECPVCGDPQMDGEHLANHLAFTAMVRGGDHETWLDERVSDWGALGPDELATHVVEEAEQAEYPQVFEDTTDGHDHGAETRSRDARTGPTDLPPGAEAMAQDALDEDTADVLAEARELTRQRRSAAENDEDEE